MIQTHPDYVNNMAVREIPGQGHSSVVVGLPSRHKTLGSVHLKIDKQSHWINFITHQQLYLKKKKTRWPEALDTCITNLGFLQCHLTGSSSNVLKGMLLLVGVLDPTRALDGAEEKIRDMEAMK